MIREDERLDDLLRAALAEHVTEAVPGPDSAILRRVRERIAGAARRRRRRQRMALAIAAAAAALAIATGAAFATGVVRLNQPIHFVPQAVWTQHFQEEHHGTTGKGSWGLTRPATLTEAQRTVRFHVRTLHGLAGAELIRVTTSTVIYRDGGQYPEVELDYRVGTVLVYVSEAQDPDPKAPLEIPGQLYPNQQVVTIDGSQYLFVETAAGRVTFIQFKTSDGGTMWINIGATGKGSGVTGKGSPTVGADPAFAEDVVRHLT